MNPVDEKKIIDDFHKLYYSKRYAWCSPWLGAPISKSPLDLWMYQEIIFETKPTLLIECGSHVGGSALYFASIFDLIGQGRVISIELKIPVHLIAKEHKRIEFIIGNTIDKDIFDKVVASVKPDDKVMVSLDSDHQAYHVLQEMKLYGELVSLGNYMVVEDSNIDHPIQLDYHGGPYEAIDSFLKTTNMFVIDKTRERFLLTFNPNGYLKRVR